MTYAPAREDGLKPWHVHCFQEPRIEAIAYAATRSEAERSQRPDRLYVTARRATTADVERLA